MLVKTTDNLTLFQNKILILVSFFSFVKEVNESGNSFNRILTWCRIRFMNVLSYKNSDTGTWSDGTCLKVAEILYFLLPSGN